MVSKGDVIAAAGGLAVALGITYFFLRSSGLITPRPSGETQACACPPGTQGCNDPGASCQGSCMTNPVYQTTDDISMMTVNLTSKQTQTIQGFVNGQGGQVFPWTGGQNFFTINYGCGPWPTGTFTFYSLTTFTDGSQAKSNSVTFQIVQGSGGATCNVTQSLSCCYGKGVICASGTVTDQNGNPLPNVPVYTSVDGGNPYLVTYTGSDGTYNYAVYVSPGVSHTVRTSATYQGYTCDSPLQSDTC